MSRLAYFFEYEFADGTPKPVKLKTMDEYLAGGGSKEYLLYLCDSFSMPKIGQVFEITITKGWWFWRKYYRIWALRRACMDHDLFNTEFEALSKKMILGF